MKTLTLVALSFSVLMASAQSDKQRAVNAFQAHHQQACAVASAVCDLPTLQMSSPRNNNLSEAIMDGLDDALVELATEYNQINPNSLRAKQILEKKAELRRIRTNIAGDSFLFDLSFYAK